jgi:hypothetical protein
LKVFDLLGREITVLFSGYLNAGDHRCRWNAGHTAGGVYIYTLETQHFLDTGKLMLIR